MSNKRSRSTKPAAQTTTVDSAARIMKFSVDYKQIKPRTYNVPVHSDIISAGGHMWQITCHYRVSVGVGGHCYLYITVEHVTKPSSVKAIVQIFLVDRHGNSSLIDDLKRSRTLSSSDSVYHSWPVHLTDKMLESYLVDGQFTILCAIMVVRDDSGSSISVPPSDISKHLGSLLDSADGTDVSFDVDGETFRAHRAVLAARSPVLKAELFGSMAEATTPSITLQDIAPATFRAMLRFMYTDSLITGGNELGGDTPSESNMMQDLLAAADRYALDRLKFIFAQQLWDSVSVDTVAATLGCAEMYNCLELKNNCIDFCAKEENFKKVVSTNGFLQLGLQFPSIIDELREKVWL